MNFEIKRVYRLKSILLSVQSISVYVFSGMLNIFEIVCFSQVENSINLC